MTNDPAFNCGTIKRTFRGETEDELTYLSLVAAYDYIAQFHRRDKASARFWSEIFQPIRDGSGDIRRPEATSRTDEYLAAREGRVIVESLTGLGAIRRPGQIHVTPRTCEGLRRSCFAEPPEMLYQVVRHFVMRPVSEMDPAPLVSGGRF